MTKPTRHSLPVVQNMTFKTAYGDRPRG